MNGKKLYKKQDGKKIAGVCGGVAEFIGIDVTIVRVAWILFCLAGGCGALVYLIAALVMPSESDIFTPPAQ